MKLADILTNWPSRWSSHRFRRQGQLLGWTRWTDFLKGVQFKERIVDNVWINNWLVQDCCSKNWTCCFWEIRIPKFVFSVSVTLYKAFDSLIKITVLETVCYLYRKKVLWIFMDSTLIITKRVQVRKQVNHA